MTAQRTMRLVMAALAVSLVASLIACRAANEPTAARSESGDSALALTPPPGPFVPGEPAPVIAHPDQLSLLHNDDPALAANKRLLFDMWRTVLNAGQLEAADELVAEDYIQHSPFQRSGRQALKDVFSVIPRRDEIPAEMRPPPVTILAEDDLVVFVAVEEMPEPDGSGSYTTTHFNLFRVANGMLSAHWHPDQTPPCPDLPSAANGGPQPVTGAAGIAQFALLASEIPALARNKRLVFDAWRHLFDAGHEELVEIYLSEDYVEHNPNAASGRAGARAWFAGLEDRPIPAALGSDLVAMIAEGDLVVQVLKIELPNPYRPGDSYTTTRMDMFRIADGRIAEHWDASVKPGTVVEELGAACAEPAQDLEITPAEARTSARGPETAYTGVGIAEFLFRANDASNLTAAEISFEPGARTAWHNHPAGQYLIVTAGIGWVQARGEVKRIVRAGDVVWTPPGVFHWHGATATQGMRHFAVWEFVEGSGGELGEHVSDEEYLAEAATN